MVSAAHDHVVSRDKSLFNFGYNMRPITKYGRYLSRFQSLGFHSGQRLFILSRISIKSETINWLRPKSNVELHMSRTQCK